MPAGWAWCRIKEIVLINPRNKLDDNLEVAFIPMSYIEADYKNTHNQEVKQWKEIKTGFTHFAENDVAIAKISPCFENRKSVILHNLKNGFGAGTTELFILRTSSIIIPDYLLWIVKTDSFINAGVGNFSGVVGQQRLAKDVVENYLIPLPPIEEQNRIASSIRTAFKHIDFIDKNSSDLLSSIKQAKSKILDLAIHGKLVPQDPNDEPAEELLKRIATSDNRPYEKLDEECIPFELPTTWKWVKLKDITNYIGDGDWIESKDQSEKGIRLIQTGNIGFGNFKDKEGQYHFISTDTFERLNCNEIFEGDVLISRLPEPVGRACILPKLEERCITAVDCSILRINENIISKELFVLYTQSNKYLELIKDNCTGTTRLRISRSNLEKIYVPLPPLNEQKRILTKLNLLFQELDKIILNLV